MPTWADKGVLDILRIAEQYHAKEGEKKTSEQEKVNSKTPTAYSPNRLRNTPGKTFSTAELKCRLALREREVSQLIKENCHLRSQLVTTVSATEVTLHELLSKVNVQLKAAQVEHEQVLDVLAEQASLARNSLESQILSLTHKVGALEATNAALQSANQKDIDALKLICEQYQSLTVENESLQAEATRLNTLQKAMPVVNAEALSTLEVRQTYAAGVMMGRDVLVMQQARASLGLTFDNSVLLAGLRDALNNQVLLNSDALLGALTSAEETAQNARQAIATKYKKVGKTYLTKFKQGKEIQQDPLGFWYRIDYLGDGEMIKDDESLVDAVVVEKLTDGTVVEDMDARGRVISQPLNEYPALFRTALTQLKEHGSMTLVVPSALAYGDDGYPPKVPSGATLVYTLRVEQVKVSPKPSEAEKGIPEQKAKPAEK